MVGLQGKIKGRAGMLLDSLLSSVSGSVRAVLSVGP